MNKTIYTRVMDLIKLGPFLFLGKIGADGEMTETVCLIFNCLKAEVMAAKMQCVLWTITMT